MSRKCFKTSRDMVRHLEALLEQGVTATAAIQADMMQRFGSSPCTNTLDWWIRKMGIRRHNSHAAIRPQFLAFAGDHPELGPYNLAKAFNAAHGYDVTGQLATYWLRRAAA